MSRLYGCVQGDGASQPATQRSNHSIDVWAQTEQGRIGIWLNDAGEFEVRLYPVVARKGVGYGKLLACGSVNDVVYD